MIDTFDESGLRGVKTLSGGWWWRGCEGRRVVPWLQQPQLREIDKFHQLEETNQRSEKHMIGWL